MKQKNLIYDVGMHIGGDTEFYLKKGFNVVAFEADPELAELGRRRFSREINAGRLTIVEGAIVDVKSMVNEKGNVFFFKDDQHKDWGTVCANWAERNKGAGSDSHVIEVKAVDFTACLEQYGIPYYLKIDIEGMDMLCLKALLSFPEKPDYVSLESDKKHFSGLKDEFNLLRDLGYNAFQIVDQGLVPLMKEPLNTREGTHTGHVFTIGNSGLFGKDLPASGWLRRNEALMGYRKLFVKYFFDGDVDRSAYLQSRFWGKCYRRILRMCMGGVRWYDTHACRIDDFK